MNEYSRDHTRSRSAELRTRSRRIFLWSLAAAVGVHVFVIGFASWRLQVAESRAPEVAGPSAMQWTGAPVDIFFGPPRIFLADGALSEEPPSRFLEAARSIRTPGECATTESRVERTPGSGTVRLTVNSSGRIDAVGMEQGTGDPCWDAVVRLVARDLRYEWLPDERFPSWQDREWYLRASQHCRFEPVP